MHGGQGKDPPNLTSSLFSTIRTRLEERFSGGQVFGVIIDKLRIKKLNFSLPLLLILGSSLILNFFFFQKIQTYKEGISVLGVIDGDTLVLEGKVRLRLRNLDAPELEYCGGAEAKAELEKWVSGKKVVVKEEIIDQRGRPMALIYAEGVLVNLEMLKSGWARFHSDSTSVRSQLKETADKAKEKSLGIFSPKCYQKTNPKNSKCNIKGNLDKDANKKIYYFPGCSQYEFTIIEKDLGEDWFCTEKEAQRAGFTRAETCPN